MIYLESIDITQKGKLSPEIVHDTLVYYWRRLEHPMELLIEDRQLESLETLPGLQVVSSEYRIYRLETAHGPVHIRKKYRGVVN